MGTAAMPLTEKQAKMMHALYKSEYWPALELILMFVQESTQIALRDPKATLDEMRVHQGRIQGVQLVAQAVSEDIAGHFAELSNPE